MRGNRRSARLLVTRVAPTPGTELTFWRAGIPIGCPASRPWVLETSGSNRVMALGAMGWNALPGRQAGMPAAGRWHASSQGGWAVEQGRPEPGHQAHSALDARLRCCRSPWAARSGRRYMTPVNVFAAEDGYVFALTYGPDTDWVKNVVAASGCELHTRRRTIQLVSPRLCHDQSRRAISPVASSCGSSVSRTSYRSKSHLQQTQRPDSPAR